MVNSAGFRYRTVFINLSRVQAVYDYRPGRPLAEDGEVVAFRVLFFSSHEFEQAGDLKRGDTAIQFIFPPEEHERFLKALEVYWSGA